MYTLCLTYVYPLQQVTLIYAATDRAKSGSRIHCLSYVSDHSDDIVEVLIKCMECNTSSCMCDITSQGLVGLQEMAVNLLDLLNINLPTKAEEGRLEFEKANHGIASCTRSVP